MRIKQLFVLLFSASSLISNAQVLFDPATYPKDSLSEGMAIDTIDGDVYVRIILNEWNTYIKTNPAIVINENSTHFRTVAKLGAGVSEFPLATINTFLKLVDVNYAELAAAGSASSATFAKYQVQITKIDEIGYIQVAGQETTNWTPVIGDTLWIGKLFFEDMAAPSAPGNLAASVDTSSVNLTWDASTDNASVSGYVVSQDGEVLDTVKQRKFEVTGLANGTYTFTVVAIDASGNHSTASSVEAIVSMPTGVHTQTSERLKVYPNPVSSTLHVNRVQDILEINIITMTGSKVRTVHNTNMVDVADLREGLYLVQVKTPSGVFSTTFIKE